MNSWTIQRRSLSMESAAHIQPKTTEPLKNDKNSAGEPLKNDNNHRGEPFKNDKNSPSEPLKNDKIVIQWILEVLEYAEKGYLGQACIVEEQATSSIDFVRTQTDRKDIYCQRIW